MTHVTAGGIAGAVAAAVTTPLDVCKTLLQTRGLSDDAAIRNARGLGDAFRIIYSRHGLAGFARGMTPRVLTNMPSNALCCASSSLSLSLPARQSHRAPHADARRAPQGCPTRASASSSRAGTTSRRRPSSPSTPDPALAALSLRIARRMSCTTLAKRGRPALA